MRQPKGKRQLFWTSPAWLLLFWATLAVAAPLAGRLILIQGEVAVRPLGTTVWQAARLNQDLAVGDAVRTGINSRAAILSQDESQIKLNENTVLVLKKVFPSRRLSPGEVTPAAAPTRPEASVYQVIQGEIWLRNSKEEFLFELETPTVTATIRGTEFNVRVQRDGATNIILLQGSLKLANAFGEVWLKPGEEALTRPGEAPTKRILVEPADAVQWSLFYPGFFSYRDLPLAALEGPEALPGGATGAAGTVRLGVEAYDQGRLREAGEAAQRALAQDPGNPGALTLAGWVSLQRRQPEEALGYFQRIKQPGPGAVIGAALARYRLGDAVGAYALVKGARPHNPGPPLLAVMEGYFAMVLGKPQEARRLFTAAAGSPSPVAVLLARCYLAQMDIVQNRKGAARAEAERALSLKATSPLALLTMALVDIAFFDHPAARRHLEKALDADPTFVDASVYLARLYLGADNLRPARRLMEQTLRQAPRDPNALALSGFVHLAFRNFEEARELFTRALKESPRLGEPHLGLSLYHFRYRQFPDGLAEMLAATLLDPRVSLFQSELGKAFYQVKAFDRALETWDYAATLDPRDPTPHFYKGIALTDLNRPGEAIQSINRSLALNDNRGVFRSRLGLDRDMAVRNFNLARAYDQLGLGEWALSKALTAVKYDPLNSSAHLFLANSYAASGQRVTAQDAENLIYRVLSPANQNTFQYLLNNDYTQMFEMPYARATVQAGVGSWEEKKTIQEYAAAAYGGTPGTAFYAEGDFLNDRGFRRRNGDNFLYNAQAAVKWEPTVFGTLTGFVQYADIERGDTGNLNDYSYQNENLLRQNARLRLYELAYVQRFTPNCTFLLYGTYQNLLSHQIGVFNQPLGSGVSVRSWDFANVDWDYFDIQAQQQLVLGQHTLIGGFDYFGGSQSFRQNGIQDILVNGQLLFRFPYAQNIRPPERSYTFYLLDYWRLTPWLLAELGVFKDFAKNARYGYPHPLSSSRWSPRFGLNIQLNPRHTIRLALQQHLNTHLILQPLLVPSEVAGFPWPLDSNQGAVVREAGAAWEAQWDDKTYTVLRFGACRVDTPEYVTNMVSGRTFNAWTDWKRYQATLVLNRILTGYLGLTLGVTGKRVMPDQSFQPFLQAYSEVDGLFGLSFLTPTGWQGGMRTFLVHQNLRGRDNNLFALVNLRFGKELANKRGLVSLEVQNLFNRHFTYFLEPMRDPEFYPARRLMFRVALYF